MQSTKRKGKPVAVNTPYVDVSTYVRLNDEKKAIDRTLKSLKPRVEGLIPTNRDAVIFDHDDNGDEAKYGNKLGQYKVLRVTSDRRQPDDDKLEALLMEKQLYSNGTTTTVRVDHDKIRKLVDDGLLTPDDIERCMVGVQVKYVLVTFEETKRGA